MSLGPEDAGTASGGLLCPQGYGMRQPTDRGPSRLRHIIAAP
ncbi:hypothetical protein Rumeso_00560 [Rubellimicrobium mesophilum DSM 19309]|uniref:Uncharacterized protein n=1 Tax=Rubellimicrobium mesophilum DSM 19309 TaxID=442562 RepID=A0A017HUJ1_9RHOB|nr:hypothetical protein Rumeso_00560 [Rubellimicrobium mesophilum DSM 19309]